MFEKNIYFFITKRMYLPCSQEDLLFRDSFCLKSLEGLRLVLVDHNILPAEDSELESRVVAVLDHHQLEREETSSVR